MLNHMKTTMIIDDDLYLRVKKLAVEQRRTATSVVDEALRHLIAAQSPATRPSELRFHTFSSPVVTPGIDLNRHAAVQDYLDETDPDFTTQMARHHVDA